jgi:hypothetical protein
MSNSFSSSLLKKAMFYGWEGWEQTDPGQTIEAIKKLAVRGVFAVQWEEGRWIKYHLSERVDQPFCWVMEAFEDQGAKELDWYYDESVGKREDPTETTRRFEKAVKEARDNAYAMLKHQREEDERSIAQRADLGRFYDVIEEEEENERFTVDGQTTDAYYDDDRPRVIQLDDEGQAAALQSLLTHGRVTGAVARDQEVRDKKIKGEGT